MHLMHLLPYMHVCKFQMEKRCSSIWYHIPIYALFFLVFVYLVIFEKDKEEPIRTISMYLVPVPLCSNIWPFHIQPLKLQHNFKCEPKDLYIFNIGFVFKSVKELVVIYMPLPALGIHQLSFVEPYTSL